MQLQEIRRLVRDYEHTWYLRKLFYGDHAQAIEIKSYLDKFANLPDQYELSQEEMFNLVKLVNSKSNLHLLQEIRNLFNNLEVETYNALDKLNLATVSNFTMFNQSSYDVKYDLYALISVNEPTNINLILKSVDDELRQKIVDTLFNLYKMQYSPTTQMLHRLFSVLHKNNLLNKTNLSYLIKNRDYLHALQSIVTSLDAFNLLTNTIFASVCELSYLYKLENVLTEIAKSKNNNLDADILNLILLRIDKYEFDQIVLILNSGNCLNKEGLERLVNLDSISQYQILPILKILQNFSLLDDITLKLVCDVVKDHSDYGKCLKKLSNYNLLNRDVIHQLACDSLKELNDVFSYLADQQLESANTVYTTLQLFLRDNLEELSGLLDCFEKSKVKISEANFNSFSSHSHQTEITKIFKRLAQADAANNENLQELQLLSNSQFEFISKFVEDNRFGLNQEAFDDIVQIAKVKFPDVCALPLPTPSSKIGLLSPLKNDDAIKSLTDNFYANSQKIIEDFYLQPLIKTNSGSRLPTKVKTNLKDGCIERELHGAMHAGRVQFYTKILHEKIKEIFPDYSKTTVSFLSNTLNLSEAQLVMLIRYAALFHDSARENESNDLWDKDSAKNCLNYLTAHGLSPDLAELFSMAAAYKDKPNEYKEFLLSKHIDEEYIPFYQYIRKLIYLSDCFDIMRCVGKFNLAKILAALTDIQEYDAKTHEPVVIEFAKEIYQLIRDQKDMLFACKIILPNGGELPVEDRSSFFELKHKVGFEHAENACSALGQSIKEHPYFTKYLENENFLSTRKAELDHFNPYIHGTNSFVLSLLERTRLSMVSPVEMLESYGVAPMGGEITGGGLETVTARCNTCFGRLNSKDGNDYTLNKIINNYTHFTPSSDKGMSHKAATYIDKSREVAFSNVNIMLIYLARAKQLGVDAISKTESTNLINEMDATVQFFYLVLLFGKRIHPNFGLIAKYSKEEKLNLFDAIYTHLDYKNLLDRIIKSNINIKEIYANPTNENIIKLLPLLELPKESIIKSGLSEKLKFVTLPETQLFTVTPQQYKTTELQADDDPDYYFYRMSQNLEGYSINKLIRRFALGGIAPQYFTAFETKCLEHINALIKKSEILNKIVLTDLNVMKFSNREKYFLDHPFPMILISEAEDKISIFSFQSQEYRAKEPLTLGKDIKMIATDTEEHRLALMKYLEENHIYNTQVILFHQLFLSQLTGQSPKSTYTHKDGFPSLSWLAAKKTPENVFTENKSINAKLSAAERYRSLRFG